MRRHLLNIANQSGEGTSAREGTSAGAKPGSWNSEWIDSNEFSGRGRTSLRGTTVLGERRHGLRACEWWIFAGGVIERDLLRRRAR